MTVELTEQQLLTLDTLGIQVWQRRYDSSLQPKSVSSSAQENTLETGEAIQSDFTSQAALLICCPVTEMPTEHRLFSNLIKAIGALGLSFDQCDSRALTALSIKQSMPQNILVFGEFIDGLSDDLQNRCISFPTLADLILDPSCKADVWLKICQLAQKPVDDAT